MNVEALSFFSVLPTLVLGISIVFTLFPADAVAGKASSQVMYWLPVTWQEHTLSSILANLLGWPAAVVVGLSSGLIVFSAFNGLILQAILTMFILFAAAFFASAITEIVRVVQVRFTGAVYKSSGRAAIWIRFIHHWYSSQYSTLFISTRSSDLHFHHNLSHRPKHRVVRAFCLACPDTLRSLPKTYTCCHFCSQPSLPSSSQVCTTLLSN